MNRFQVLRSGASQSGSVIAASVFGAVLLPLLANDFTCFQVTQILIFAIAILGLNLLTGFNGQISLGHGAFFAAGAYITAILMERSGVPYWATIPVAGLVCLVAGFLFGLPVLRLRGHYLAMATFALALAVPQLLKYKALEDWTGGAQGLTIAKPLAPFELVVLARKMSDDVWLYYVTLAVTIVAFATARNLARGRMGRALMAIRDHQVAAEAMGVNGSIVKALAFGVSAMYTGIAGALAAIVTQFVAPDSFTMTLSIALLVGLVVGGLGAIPGAFLGGAFIVFVPNIANEISRAATGAVYGVFLILMMYFMPDGMWPRLEEIARRLRIRLKARKRPVVDAV